MNTSSLAIKLNNTIRLLAAQIKLHLICPLIFKFHKFNSSLTLNLFIGGHQTPTKTLNHELLIAFVRELI